MTRYGSFVGMSCVDAVESPRVDIIFVSAHGVSGGYAYHQDQPIIAGKLAMLACADQKIYRSITANCAVRPCSRCARCRHSTLWW